MGDDVRDILDLDLPNTPEPINKELILGTDKKQKLQQKKKLLDFKRPEGMHREVFALLYADKKDAPPLMLTDTGQGYKQMKAKLGMKKVRPWRWMQFNNPARKDHINISHWRRVADEGKDYPFAKFNKPIQVPSYTDAEYQQRLQVEGWTRAETDHLFDLCRRFDLRFIVMSDRWDRTTFPDRTIEDLKDRYYDICSILTKARTLPGPEPKMSVYDADHERRRKEQLRRLFDRTPEQIEEEQTLISELRKIEMRKKERDKKTQDLQKLITAADNNTETRRQERKIIKKKPIQQKINKTDAMILESAGIKFPDFKSNGVTLRSQRMKLPAAVGQKKTKAIEQLLQELGIELNPMPTEEICTNFNELRSDMVLLYELKLALANCEFELQTLRHQHEAMQPGKVVEMKGLGTPDGARSPGTSGVLKAKDETSMEPRLKTRTNSSEFIDVVGSPQSSNLKTVGAAPSSR